MAQNLISTRLFYRYSLLAALLLFVPTVSPAQSGGGIDATGTGGRHSITGRLIFPSGQRADSRLKIRLESPGVGDLTVLSDVNGNFTFQSLRPGNYTVTVDGGENFESTRESIFIEPSVVMTRRGPTSFPMTRPFNVQIYLRPKNEGAAANKPGVINAALASLPKPAVESYEKGLEFARAGETDKAIEQLKRAVELHPNFGLALNELGVQYMKKGQYDKAADALGKVVQLSPDAPEPILNHGIALFNLKKIPEAEIQLRAAVKKNDRSFAAHHYLGMTLIAKKSFADAETELRRAIELGGPRAGLAHYYLGGVYWQTGKLQQAADELEAYLKLEPAAPQAEKIRGTIKDLRSKQ
jgi:Flp pilus assembly protein TadD